MPSRKEIQWSQLKVGILVLVAVAVLIGLVFLMSGSTGGLFAHKLTLRTYFQNAGGLKNGAPVTLEGVTIGNVTRIRIVPARNPSPVEVTFQVNEKASYGLHADSTTSIAQAGVLGDSYVDISSRTAKGPPPADNAELVARNVPSIQQVVDTSQETLQKASLMMSKVNIVLDTLNSKKGTAGEFLNDPKFYNKTTQLIDNLNAVAGGIRQGKGSLGKLMTDETLYNKLNASVDRLNQITESVAEGRGTAGKLLHDETLYNNFNAAAANINKLVQGINEGKGAIGKAMEDPAFAKKMDATVTNLNDLLQGLNEGKGSMGQLMKNRSLYDHLDQTADQAQQLVKEIRTNPKKYLVIHMRIF